MEINSKSSLSLTPQGEAAWRTQGMPPAWRDLLAAVRRAGGAATVADILDAMPGTEAAPLRTVLSDLASRGWLLVEAHSAHASRTGPVTEVSQEATPAQPGLALEALLARSRAARGADRPGWAAATEPTPSGPPLHDLRLPELPPDPLTEAVAALEPAPPPAASPTPPQSPPAHAPAPSPEPQEPASQEPVDVRATPEQDAAMLRDMGLIEKAPSRPVPPPPRHAPSHSATAATASRPVIQPDPRREEALRRMRFDKEQRTLSRMAVKRGKAEERAEEEAARLARAARQAARPPQRQDSAKDILARIEAERRARADKD